MASDELDFRPFQFRSPESSDRKWLEWFREEYGRRLYNIDVDPKPDAPFRLDVTTRLLPDVAISQSVGSSRRTSHHGDGSDDFIFQFVLSGHLSIQVGGEAHEITPGMAGIGRRGAAAILDIPAEARLVGIRLRRKLIEPLVGNFSELRGLAVLQDSQALRLLLAYVRTLDTEDAIETPEARYLVSTHIHDLVALAYGATRDAGTVIAERGKRAARLAAVKADILDNLASPRLSVATLAARHGVTPRYIHMLFEAEGVTYSEFVLGHRLLRAHRMLSDPRFVGMPLNSIALQVGFGDLSYFNRTFRRRFGASPSQVRAAFLGRKPLE
jgi:AraC-like DNA-binding protein